MTPAHLIRGLASNLRVATAQIRFPLEYARDPAQIVPVQVFEQYLPEALFEREDYYPCVTVELLKVTDDKTASEVDLGLGFGVYAYEADGWLALFHLMEVCRVTLLSKRVVAQRFRLKEATWQIVESDLQPRPFLFGTAQATYSIFQPVEGFNP